MVDKSIKNENVKNDGKREMNLSALLFLLAFFGFGWLGDLGYYYFNIFVNTDGILVIFWDRLELVWGQNFMNGFKYVGGTLIGGVLLYYLQEKKFFSFSKCSLFQKILIIVVIALLLIAQISFISHSESLLCK